jgi:hypothetical protein
MTVKYSNRIHKGDVFQNAWGDFFRVTAAPSPSAVKVLVVGSRTRLATTADSLRRNFVPLLAIEFDCSECARSRKFGELSDRFAREGIEV